MHFVNPEISLTLSKVRIEVPGQVLLEDVDLSFRAGEVVVLIGPNGAGKTTLLRTALGLQPPHFGQVTLRDRPLHTLSPRERAQFMGWLPQQTEVSEPLDAWEVVAAARYRFRESKASSRAAANRALVEMGAAHLANRRFSVLSGGERQRVAWAALLAQEAPLLLVDEPASHLDPAQQCEAYRRIGLLWRKGHGILCITHDVNLLAFVGAPEAIRIVGLKKGRMAWTTQLSDPHLAEALSSLFETSFDEFEEAGRRCFFPRFEGTPCVE